MLVPTIGMLAQDPSSFTTATIKTLFQELDKGWKGSSSLIDQLGLWIKSYANEVTATLRQQTVQDPTALTTLTNTVEEVAKSCGG